MNKRKLSGILVLLSPILFSCSQEQALNNSNSYIIRKTPVPVATIDELASGKKVYETNCMICHRSDGTGGKVSIERKSLNVENLTTEKVKGFSDEKIIGYIMNGIEDEGMPPFKGKLTEGEMRDVVKFIRTELQHVGSN
ncbi:MAG: c-type cytochrome [Pyrinomonadaceae bacterium]